MNHPVELRVLDAERDRAELQRVLEEAPAYALAVSGAPQPPTAAEEELRAVPPGFSLEAKRMLGVYSGGPMVGCLDLLRGWPSRGTAMIGLLLLSEKVQRKGLGAAAFEGARAWIRTEWPEVHTLRIAVVLTNSSVLAFWKKRGFVENGVRKPYENGSVRSECVVLERPL